MSQLIALVVVAFSGAGIAHWLSQRRLQRSADANDDQSVVSFAGESALSPQQKKDALLVSLLEEEIRTRVTHPAAIQMTALDGVVTLSGPILSSEHGPLVALVRGFRGVRAVNDRLQPQRQRGDLPDVHTGSDIDEGA